MWKALPDNIRKTIVTTAVEVRDFQRKLNREADGTFVKRLEGRGMQVHAPSREEVKAWQTATAPLWEDAKKIATPALVAEAAQFRTDWEAGKYKAQEQTYIERFKQIPVPLDDVMKNFR